MNNEESDQEVTNTDPNNQRPPNPTVILIFFGMVLLFLLGLVYIFWPKDEETPIENDPTAESYQADNISPFDIAVVTCTDFGLRTKPTSSS